MAETTATNNTVVDTTGFKNELESVRLSKTTIWDAVYEYGVKNRKMPLFKTIDEEIAHYGKPIQYFNKRERKHFDDAMYELEKFFEMFPCFHEM